jgi:tripartite-type tricarboxylate transporter receptor subunit TctC
MIGAESVVGSAADGYTVLFGAASEMAMNASLFKKMQYNPRGDLQPVALVATFPLVFVTIGSNTSTLDKMLARSRKDPGTVAYGSIGYGSPQHLAGELLQMEANVVLTHVPYKGSGPLVQDALAGHVELAISSLPPAVALVKGGQLRALAVTSRKRARALPQVPTMAELGFPSYELGTWVGVSVPAGTAKPVVTRLNEALLKALGDREFRDILQGQGAEPEGSTPEQFRDFIAREIEKSDRIVSKAKIQLD